MAAELPPAAGALSKTSLWLALLVLLLLVAAPLAYRNGVLDLGSTFTLLRYSVYAAAAIVLLSAFALFRALRRGGRNDVLASAHALPIALLPVLFLMFQLASARSVPPIHDITTDALNPPAIQALQGVPERSLSYEGDKVHAQQVAAYPDIAPLELPIAPAAALQRAEAAARELGWEVSAVNADESRLQAVDTSWWFGFKDDVAIRITAAGDSSRIDVRSVSRVGVSDLGKNAARIRDFNAQMKSP